jgi:hypothetical protein
MSDAQPTYQLKKKALFLAPASCRNTRHGLPAADVIAAQHLPAVLCRRPARFAAPNPAAPSPEADERLRAPHQLRQLWWQQLRNPHLPVPRHSRTGRPALPAQPLYPRDMRHTAHLHALLDSFGPPPTRFTPPVRLPLGAMANGFAKKHLHAKRRASTAPATLGRRYSAKF